MTISVYPRTATKAKTKSATVFAFGRESSLNGHPIDKGGYAVFALSENYAGHVRGGIAKSWGLVDKNLTYAEAVALMNRKCHYKAFNEQPGA